MLVRKRDGRVEEFDPDKILESIKLAALAVEGKDPDIQKRATEIVNLRNQLIQHGFDPDEASEQAELQFEGYLEDGQYTEYDEEEAKDTLNIILESIDNLALDEDDVIETDTIQDIVEKALMINGHGKTAKEYIIKRANRERVREMNTSLMKSFEDLTFGNSEDVETKRENANIDGDSAMGTMLKYGSEGAKKFNLLYVVPPEESSAHSNGDIHIHDLDFLSLTETCIPGDSYLDGMSKDGKIIKLKRASDIDKYFSEDETGFKDVSHEDIYVNSWDTVTKVNKVARHLGNGKKLYKILAEAPEYEGILLEITGEHQVPILKRSLFTNDTDALDTKPTLEVVELIKANQLTDNDMIVYMIPQDVSSMDNLSEDEYIKAVYKSSNKNLRFVQIYSIEVTDVEDKYVYDIETESHYFNIEGYKVVHNCCQIDIEKLFNGGFNTGHGFLREPGEIRSYAALACIAIQSNQNDQHKRVA